MYEIRHLNNFHIFNASLGTHRLALWLLATGWPLLLRDVRHALHSYVGRFLVDIIKRLQSFYIPSGTSYLRYRDRDAEEEYWRSSFQLRRSFGLSGDADSQVSNTKTRIPLVPYYTPQLPPATPKQAPRDPEATEYPLSPRAFCKWHRMVFRGPLHPTLKEAKQQVKYYSSRDRQQIYRISRMLSDEKVFGVCGQGLQWSPKYQSIWKGWLERKGPDVAIVFR